MATASRSGYPDADGRRSLDRQQAIDSFHLHPALGRSTFVTDLELRAIFGPELAAEVLELERHGRERGICAACGGLCCREIGCELYRPEATRCPIHDRRPLLCRMHFCERFLAEHRQQVVGLRDVFLACLAEEPVRPPFGETELRRALAAP